MTAREHIDEWLDSASSTPRRLGLVIFVGLLALYLPTATWSLPYDPDAITIAATARQLAKTGTPVAPGWEAAADPAYFGSFGSFVLTDDGPVGQYPPGAALAAVPLYLVTPSPLEDVTASNPDRPDLPPLTLPIPTLWQATLTGAMTTAGAGAIFAMVAARLLDPRTAIAASALAGLGTSAWSVASSALFTHGPALLALAAASLALERRHWWLAGAALGGAVLVRPHLAVSAALIGLVIGWSRRSTLPVVGIGVGSGLGAVGFLAYNRWAFGTASASGGYRADFTDRLFEPNFLEWGTNLVGALISPRWGLLVWAPFLLLLIPGLRSAWSRATPEQRALALGGVAYFLIQYKLNRYNPGNSTLYRYPLEALALWAPLLVLAWRPMSGLRERAWWVTTRAAVGAQGVVSILV